MILDIPKKVKDMDKVEEEEEETDLKEEVMLVSTGQPIDRMKQIDRPVTLIVAI
jgi:hypothetical protein